MIKIMAWPRGVLGGSARSSFVVSPDHEWQGTTVRPQRRPMPLYMSWLQAIRVINSPPEPRDWLEFVYVVVGVSVTIYHGYLRPYGAAGVDDRVVLTSQIIENNRRRLRVTPSSVP